MTELTPKQQELLAETILRRQAARESAKSAVTERSKKVPMSMEEYARRLNAQITDAGQISDDKRNARVNNELVLWHDRVGERFANAKVDDVRRNRVIQDRIDRIKEGKLLHRNSLLLVGNLGTGKTWMGHAYVESLIRNGLVQNSEICMGTEISLLAPVADAGFNQQEKMDQLLSPHHKIYFIDEVGRAYFRNTQARHHIWYALINHAYVHHIPIILTTNCSTKPIETLDTQSNEQHGSELEAWIGDAALDRLRYMAGPDGVLIPSDTNQRGAANSFFDKGNVNSDL